MTICYLCNLGLGGWEEEDSPMYVVLSCARRRQERVRVSGRNSCAPAAGTRATDPAIRCTRGTQCRASQAQAQLPVCPRCGRQGGGVGVCGLCASTHRRQGDCCRPRPSSRAGAGARTCAGNGTCRSRTGGRGCGAAGSGRPCNIPQGRAPRVENGQARRQAGPSTGARPGEHQACGLSSPSPGRRSSSSSPGSSSPGPGRSSGSSSPGPGRRPGSSSPGPGRC